MSEVNYFAGDYRFLSNFYPATVTYWNMSFPTVEHAYQAAKTLDQGWRERIQKAEKPGLAKKLGKKCPIRPEWDHVKLQVMEILVREKFTVHGHLQRKLLNTYPMMLREGNHWHDYFWGCAFVRGKWIGKNNLGKILMTIRGELRNK